MPAVSQALSPNTCKERGNDTGEAEESENRECNKLESHIKRYAPFAKNQPVRKKILASPSGEKTVKRSILKRTERVPGQFGRVRACNARLPNRVITFL